MFFNAFLSFKMFLAWFLDTSLGESFVTEVGQHHIVAFHRWSSKKKPKPKLRFWILFCNMYFSVQQIKAFELKVPSKYRLDIIISL